MYPSFFLCFHPNDEKKVKKNLVYKINYFIFAPEFNAEPVRNGSEENHNNH